MFNNGINFIYSSGSVREPVTDPRVVSRTELAQLSLRRCTSQLHYQRYTPDELHDALIDSVAHIVDFALVYSVEVRYVCHVSILNVVEKYCV